MARAAARASVGRSAPRLRARGWVVAWACALGCRGVTDPVGLALPADATRYAPPPVYARWWAQVEACAGLTGAFAAYAWYEVAGARVPYPTREAVAYTEPEAHRVVIAAAFRDDGPTLRHEMLHALLGSAYADPAHWHPPAYFQGRCEGWVGCPPIGCADAGEPPPTAPADAPVVPRSALSVRVDVTPGTPSRSAADPWFQVRVVVTNPGPGPVWLDMGQNFGTAADPEYAGTGYGITRPGGSTTSLGGALEGAFGTTRRGRIPFAAGQTRVAVYDVTAAGYPAGDYVAFGFYGVGLDDPRGVSAPFSIVP